MVRRMEQRDAQRIKEICEAELGHTTTADLIGQRLEELSRDDHYYIAVYEQADTQEVYGFIQAERYSLLYGENGWNIIALAVTRAHQGKGYGKELLHSLETLAEGRGDAFIRLNSNVIRTRAHEFYQHLGYTCDKTQKRFIKHLFSSKG